MVYLAAELRKLGGSVDRGGEMVIQQSNEKFGKFHPGSPGIKSRQPLVALGEWKFPEVDRDVTLFIKETQVHLTVRSTELVKKMNDRKK